MLSDFFKWVELSFKGSRGEPLTSEARSAGTVVAAGHVLARSAVHARVGLALVVVEVTVGSTPTRVAEALVSARQRENEKGSRRTLWLVCYPVFFSTPRRSFFNFL